MYRIYGTAHRSIARVSWDYCLGCRGSRTTGPSTMARSQAPRLSVSRNGEKPSVKRPLQVVAVVQCGAGTTTSFSSAVTIASTVFQPPYMYTFWHTKHCLRLVQSNLPNNKKTLNGVIPHCPACSLGRRYQRDDRGHNWGYFKIYFIFYALKSTF